MRVERGAAYAVEGVETGLPVATAGGWCMAGSLRAGVRVVTLGGMAELRGVVRSVLSPAMARDFWPLAVPSGALGNPVGLVLPCDQRVAVGSDGGVMLIPARALVHWRGVVRVAPAGQVMVRLWFDTPEVAVGAGVLFACGGGAPLLSPGLPEARVIMARRIAFDAGRGLRQATLAKRR